MAITKTIEIAKIEVVGEYKAVQVATDTVIKEAGTELVEIEGGISENESVSIALQKAVENGVLNIINIGIDRGYWKYEQTKIIKPDCIDECIDSIRG